MDELLTYDELISAVPGYGAYMVSQKRLEDDRLLRGHLYGKLTWTRAAAERILQKLLDEGRLEDTVLPEQISRQLLQMAVSVRSRDYNSCCIFNDPLPDNKILGSLSEIDRRCVGLAHELQRYIRAFRRTLFSCNMQEDEMSEQCINEMKYINEMMYADYYFDELKGDLETETIRRDHLIMNTEEKQMVTGGL